MVIPPNDFDMFDHFTLDDLEELIMETLEEISRDLDKRPKPRFVKERDRPPYLELKPNTSFFKRMLVLLETSN